MLPRPSMLVLRRILHLAFVGGSLWGATAVRAASSARQIEALYAPFRVEQAALAPDGRHVAFALRGDRGLEIQIFKTDSPGQKATVLLDRNRNTPARILNWISPEQLLAVSGTPVVMVTDPTGGAVRPVNLTHLFRGSAGDAGDDQNLKRPDARILAAPDDPACLLFESNIPVPAESGFPGRPRILELHRLNVLTGEVRRVMDYDVEQETPPGATIVDREGKPRIVYRYGAEPAHFAYRTTDSEAGAPGLLARMFVDGAWRDLHRLFEDRATFSFSLAASSVLTKRTIPLGFDSDPNLLLFGSNLGRDTYGIYAADLRTGKRTALAVEESGIDLVEVNQPWLNPPLIFDRHQGKLAGIAVRSLEPTTRWLDAEIGAVQREVEKKFPERRVHLLEWDQARERFLCLIDRPADPGRYFVYHRPDGRCVEYLRRAPTLPVSAMNPAESFAFDTSDGLRITGTLTLPRTPSKTAPAVVVSLHGGPWLRVEAGYDRDAQALATMGFAVVKINYRGSSGAGIAHREAIRTNLDGGPIGDVLATLDWLRTHRRVELRRVGVVGEGYGGYLALRALQLHPDAFQSAVAINAPISPLDLWRGLEPEMEIPNFNPDAPPPKATFKAPGVRNGSDPTRALVTWLVSKQSGLGGISVARRPELLTKPVFLLHDPDNREALFQPIADLRATLRRQNRSPEWMQISPLF
ncbi:MAG: alpha/beta fold hydrolase [Opitutaceae bacterium]